MFLLVFTAGKDFFFHLQYSQRRKNNRRPSVKLKKKKRERERDHNHFWRSDVLITCCIFILKMETRTLNMRAGIADISNMVIEKKRIPFILFIFTIPYITDSLSTVLGVVLHTTSWVWSLPWDCQLSAPRIIPPTYWGLSWDQQKGLHLPILYF